MASNVPESVKPYPNISAKAYEHPADRAATAALKSVPMLDVAVGRLIEWRYERALRQFYLGSSVKAGEHQLSELWASHVAVSHVLDVPDRPDVYVTSEVRGGAQTIGVGKPMIVIDSLLLQRLGPREQRALLGHELGHILSEHVLYATALDILLSVTGGLPFFLGIPFRAVRAVLLEWYRAAELTCDRAAVLAVRDPRVVCGTLMVTAAGMPVRELNLDAFIAQAMEYESWDDAGDRVRRFLNELGQSHANAVRRVSEVMRWVQSGDYDRIVRGEYRTRDQKADARAEAGDAVAFYTERFRAFFSEAQDEFSTRAAQVGGAAEQLADWIRSRGGGSGSAPGSPEAD